MKKRWQIPFLLFLIVATVWIIRRNAPHNAPFQRSEGAIFGTLWHATYQCDSSLTASIIQELWKVDGSMSMFNPKSTLSRINKNESDECDSLLSVVLTQALQISKATNGCFDITVAPLVNAWGFGFKNSNLPDSTKVDSLLKLVGFEKLTLEDGRLTKADPDMLLDLSAIAKGFGVDQVAHLFNRLGIQNYMIEIGGEIVVRGHNPNGKAWSIGVNKPDEDGESTNHEIQEILSLTDCALATSGNYRNFYIDDNGKKVAHTIDPHTGYPVQHTILSSTVLAPTCAMADAFATSFMVMGLDSAKVILEQQPQLKAYFIYSDENGAYQTWRSPSFPKE